MQKTCTQKVQPQKPWPRKMQKNMQNKCNQKCKTKCNFWKFVFVKHAHFQNLHFFSIFFAFVSHFFCFLFAFYVGFFAIFEKIEALTKPPPKNAKNMQFAFVLFFGYFFRMFFAFFSHFFAVFFAFYLGFL